jgi:hypothetical protein
MFYTYPITRKHFFHIPSQEKCFIHMPSQDFFFIFIPSRKMIIIIHIPSRESIRFICHLSFSVSLYVVFVFQSRFKNSYWNDLKQLDYTDLNELAKKLPIIAKSSKSANSIKKYLFTFNKFRKIVFNRSEVIGSFFLNWFR